MLREMKITKYIDSVANNKAFPGGGSVAALAGSLASALASMVAELTIGKKGYESVNDDMKQISGRCAEFCKKLNELIDLDSDAYKMVMQAFKLPKDSEQQKLNRVVAIQDAILYATKIPLQTMENVRRVADLLLKVAKLGNKNTHTDAGVGALLLVAASEGAYRNVEINLDSLKDKQAAAEIAEKAESLLRECKQISAEIRTLLFG